MGRSGYPLRPIFKKKNNILLLNEDYLEINV